MEQQKNHNSFFLSASPSLSPFLSKIMHKLTDFRLNMWRSLWFFVLWLSKKWAQFWAQNVYNVLAEKLPK